MRLAVGFIAKLRQENEDLEANVRALDSVWTKKTFIELVPWLRRRVHGEAERAK
jgi:hypothetical protein